MTLRTRYCVGCGRMLGRMLGASPESATAEVLIGDVCERCKSGLGDEIAEARRNLDGTPPAVILPGRAPAAAEEAA